MKKILFCLILNNYFLNTLESQKNECDTILLKKIYCDTIMQKNFNSEFMLLTSYKKSDFKNAGYQLKKLILESEKDNDYEDKIKKCTREMIATQKFVYPMVLLEKCIEEDEGMNLFLKKKLINEVSNQITLLCKNQFSMYSYETKNRKLLKFISIRSGNDLFTLGGIIGEVRKKGKYINDNRIFFQRNDDRDYTGSFLIELGTDYLSTLRKNPLNTYQTLFYGFDVYSPYFRDTNIFKTQTSYNPLDRPYASFQYFGWSKKMLPRNNKFNRVTTIKFGKIGGDLGSKFQNALHQDISSSPRPIGWGAQVANGGRVGISIEYAQTQHVKKLSRFTNEYSLTNIMTSILGEIKLGTYQTGLSFGIQIANRAFRQTNPNYIIKRTQIRLANKKAYIKARKIFQPFYYKISFKTDWVIHNTMLEGYGWFNTSENIKTNYDPLTPYSQWYLDYNKVKRLVPSLNITLSYTFKYMVLFYNWSSFGPDTKNENIGIKSRYSGEYLNIKNRWHHFAEIGLIFYIE